MKFLTLYISFSSRQDKKGYKNKFHDNNESGAADPKIEFYTRLILSRIVAMFRTLCSATPRPKCMRARVGFQKIRELHANTRAKRALAEKPAVIARGWPNAVWPH